MIDCSVLIGSCDDYAHLVKNFDILYKRYFQCNLPRILVSETISSSFIPTLTPGKLSWGERMLKGLHEVHTEYVIFLLEDYFFCEKVDEIFISNHISLLEEMKCEKVMWDILYPPGVYDLKHLYGEIYEFTEKSAYLNSVQPSIWKTEYLKKVLTPECSPWGFEVENNARTALMKPKIILHNCGRKYFNVCRRGGRWEDGALEFMKKENLC